MIVNEILRRSCRGVRMVVESVSGSAWNHCPDARGTDARVGAESAVSIDDSMAIERAGRFLEFSSQGQARRTFD